jgi:thymidylate synthase
LWGGFPANLAALELLKQYMASEIGVENGEIIACSKGLHIYSYAENLAKIRLGIEAFNVRREEGGI